MLRFQQKFIALLLFFFASSLSAQTDFAAERLLTIATTEEAIYKKIAEDPDFYNDVDLERRINELVQSYRGYLVDNPDDVNALILYGKLLRRVGEREQAFNAFLKADELDPEIAVVKQQIGTHLAEEGRGKAALPFYLQAADLAPEVGIYHFGLGQLLYQSRDDFISEGLFTRDALDREMVKAFREAALLEPDNFDFQMRLGEAYYDQASPDWKSALLHWKKMSENMTEGIDFEVITLHRARVLGKLGRAQEARELCKDVQHPKLQKSKQEVLSEIALH
ncbi:MAG: hypothetical protein AAGC73_02325 [Verrucomicrobiota bacterium]